LTGRRGSADRAVAHDHERGGGFRQIEDQVENRVVEPLQVDHGDVVLRIDIDDQDRLAREADLAVRAERRAGRGQGLLHRRP
jgi:hypothetical protein